MVRLTMPGLVTVMVACLLLVAGKPAEATRIRDLCDVGGVRSNQLFGYGLVVGLNGTGDSQRATMTPQAVVAMLQRLGVQIDVTTLRVRNVAAVMVTADLRPFARNGSRLDVTVASVGDATSLHGGVLLQTPLLGADNRVYSVAQGPLVVSGFSAEGSSGTREIRNVPTTARIPGGGLIERELSHEMTQEGELRLALRQPDFTTASRIAAAINEELGDDLARATDPGTVRLTMNDEWQTRAVELMARVEQINVTPAGEARVVINQRTGTVVVGEDVTLRECALAHGGLSVRIEEQLSVSQPEAFSSGGETAVVAESDVSVQQAGGRVVGMNATSTVADLVQVLNSLGVAPLDLVAIFQALHASGALQARVEVQ